VPVDLKNSATAWGPRFFWKGNALYQQSAMSPDIKWEIPQTIDVINPLSSHYNAQARYAKTLYRDGKTWGDVPATVDARRVKLAHDNSRMDCQVCHSSWVTSCFGCHLPMKANERVITNKFEGTVSRNFTTYNPQVVRDDVFMLGLDGTVKDHRSQSSLVERGRRRLAEQQSRVGLLAAADRFVRRLQRAGVQPHFPHTTSGVGTTKNCTDCHLSAQKDNNAIMAQLLGFGTGNVNFFGRYAWVGSGTGGFYGVVWTEADEPQAAIGSHLQKIAYPDNFKKHVDGGRILHEAYHHNSFDIFGGHVVQDVELRGEYLYTAAGSGGLEVDDVAEIDQKGFSQRTVSAPVSPLGQRTYVRTPCATSVALPSTLLNDPKRTHNPVNEEQPISPTYNYAFVTDLKEGLVIVDVSCLFDGDPQNNFLHKDAVFNPDGRLTGATKSFVAGRYLYVACSHGIEVVDINEPLKPKLVGEYSGSFLRNPVDLSVQFQYLFVTDEAGLKV